MENWERMGVKRHAPIFKYPLEREGENYRKLEIGTVAT